MPRKVRKTIILLKAETTAGIDAAPTGAANAVQVMDWEDDIEQMFAPLPLIRSFFGSDDALPYARRGKIKFRLPFASAGAAGTAAPWGPALLGCAAAETISAGNRVDYTPATDNLKTVTIWFHKDGLVMKFVGSMGNHRWSYVVGEAPFLEFEFRGLVAEAPSAVGNPAGTFTSWKRPLAVGPINTAKLVLGGTYATGAISGGTSWDLKSFTGDSGNDVRDVLLATAQAVDIYNRAAKATIVIDLTAAGEATYLTQMDVGTTISVGLAHGTAAGSKLLSFAPQALIKSVKTQKDGEMFVHALEVDLQPTAAGNDEWRHVAA